MTHRKSLLCIEEARLISLCARVGPLTHKSSLMENYVEEASNII